MMPTDIPDRPVKPFSLLGRVAACLWFLVVTTLFARGLVAMLIATPTGGASFSDWSAVMSRCCQIVFFITLGWLMLARPNALARREGVISTLIAFSGTYSVWLIPFLPSARISPTMQMVSAVISLIGCVAIVYAVLHLGKSFSIVPQARKLVIGGPYRFVRHPLYLAEELAVIGVLIQCDRSISLFFLALHLGLQIQRMDYEESLLRAVFPDYEAYARRTPRLIPGGWR
ncbi:MAG TPA: isoprenylcysteine carboxylmethyltransferase family protein [Alphaproteobacteria bacterium]|jgi:protein-S-isoprenylcysteine O-methyltransferase Ste14|nr:isoprenylcysteine carboxylmethyltransferase family protein [Alphaproteobacteria bacterium]